MKYGIYALIVLCCAASLVATESNSNRKRSAKTMELGAPRKKQCIEGISRNIGAFSALPKEVTKYILKLVIDQTATVKEVRKTIKNLKDVHPYFKELIREEKNNLSALSILATPRQLISDRLLQQFLDALVDHNNAKLFERSLCCLQQLGFAKDNSVAFDVLSKTLFDAVAKKATDDKLNAMLSLMLAHKCRFGVNPDNVTLLAMLVSVNALNTAKTMLSYVGCPTIKYAYDTAAASEENKLFKDLMPFLCENHRCSQCFPEKYSPLDALDYKGINCSIL